MVPGLGDQLAYGKVAGPFVALPADQLGRRRRAGSRPPRRCRPARPRSAPGPAAGTPRPGGCGPPRRPAAGPGRRAAPRRPSRGTARVRAPATSARGRCPAAGAEVDRGVQPVVGEHLPGVDVGEPLLLPVGVGEQLAQQLMGPVVVVEPGGQLVAPGRARTRPAAAGGPPASRRPRRPAAVDGQHSASACACCGGQRLVVAGTQPAGLGRPRGDLAQRLVVGLGAAVAGAEQRRVAAAFRQIAASASTAASPLLGQLDRLGQGQPRARSARCTRGVSSAAPQQRLDVRAAAR